MPVSPETLIDVYQHIAEQRMQGLPFVNPALTVEAVGFRYWRGNRVGILITPWFMNLVLIPGPEEERRDLARDKVTKWRFPGGSCEFHFSQPGGEAPHMCASLFTSVEGLPDQDTARAIAEEVLSTLFTACADGQGKPTRRGPEAESLLAKPISRRGFLRGLTLRED